MDSKTRQEMYYKALYDKGVQVPTPVTRLEMYLCKAIEHIRELEQEVEKLKDAN
jgi:hypothetical protein